MNWSLVLVSNNYIYSCLPGIEVIENAFSDSNNIHKFEQFTQKIRQIYTECESNYEGELSSYVPQLLRQNPQHFAISLCTVDGQRWGFVFCDVIDVQAGCTNKKHSFILHILLQKVLINAVGIKISAISIDIIKSYHEQNLGCKFFPFLFYRARYP